jgi:hypothetical protein
MIRPSSRNCLLLLTILICATIAAACRQNRTNSRDDLNRLLELQDGGNFSVSYLVGGQTEQAPELLRWAHISGKDRLELESSGARKTRVQLGDEVTYCLRQVIDAPETCYDGGPIGSASPRRAGTDAMVVALPTRTIAGSTADCFGLTVAKQNWEECYSADGVMLFSNGLPAANLLSVIDFTVVPGGVRFGDTRQSPSLTATVRPVATLATDFDVPSRPQPLGP